jgi:phosphofructokinase-like protein
MRSSRYQRIAISTGGGDAPGLNAVIRAATLAAIERGWEVWGIRQGYRGLLEGDEKGIVPLTRERVRGIAHLGGTILGTANRGDPFHFPVADSTGKLVPTDRSADLVRAFAERGLQALVAIGGDGSLHIARKLRQAGLPAVIGVPKTIDNDVYGTDVTFGYDTAVTIATEAIDRIHTTAEAHDRVMVVEVMGRHAGWIALRAGLAGGADVVLMPEVPFRYEPIVEKIQQREALGRHFTIVVVAEGAVLADEGSVTVKAEGDAFRGVPVLGGIGERVAAELARRTGKESRALVLGHLQRGGSPTMYDRQLALRFGAAAVRALDRGETSSMVALVGNSVGLVTLEEAGTKTKTVDLDCDTVVTAREIGVCFGDEELGTFE